MQPIHARPQRLTPGLTGWLLAGLMAGSASAQQDQLDVQAIDVPQAAVAQPVDGFIEDVPGETLDDVLGEDSKPGFSLPRGDNSEAVDDALEAFHASLDAQEWEKAFRGLIDLSESTRHMMSPIGDSSMYLPIRRSIQERLSELPPQGRRAFQLFYDAQARELLTRCKEHDAPGSEDQLRMTREVYELFFMSSIGDEAANMLGDLYFERGRFALALGCWEAILEHHPGSSLPEIDLQYKRVLAMQRAGQLDEANALAEQLALRFAGREITVGGAPRDAAGALEELLGTASEQVAEAQRSRAVVPAALPEQGTPPVWQMTFVDSATQARLDDSFSSNDHYYGPSDLRLLAPPVAADGRAVYAHWHGVVFAIDLETGKLLWRTGRFVEAATTLPQRINTPAGNPRGYKIALTDDLVLVQSAGFGNNARQPDRFSLAAYHKDTGERVWETTQMPAWRDRGFCGQPLLVNGQAYVVTHHVGAVINDEMARFRGGPAVAGGNRELTLHRIDPTTGTPHWSLPLGEADPRAIANAQFGWMPQPLMKLEGRNLYVLTNNGALVAVDTGAGEAAWAARLEPPEGSNMEYYYVEPPPDANVQGAGGIEVVDGVVYVKEARSPHLYAIDPAGQTVLWERDVPRHGELIGADREHCYVMGQAVRAYPITGQGRMAWNNRNLSGPTIGSGLMTDDTLYVQGGNKLRALSLENGDPSQELSSRFLRGSGAHLMMAGDKIVCVTRRDITVYQVPTEPAPTFEAGGETQGNQP